MLTPTDPISSFILNLDTWIISDTLFFHANIARYCDRPDGWQDLIVANWNRLVRPGETIFHLGDLALGKREQAEALFENLVAVEIYKTLAHRGEEPLFYSWRTSAGAEVDFIVEHEGGLVPVEAKLSATPRTRMARGIAGFRGDFGERAGRGFVVHPGDTVLPLGDGAIALPFSAF
jgi:hypothetical protein